MSDEVTLTAPAAHKTPTLYGRCQACNLEIGGEPGYVVDHYPFQEHPAARTVTFHADCWESLAD